MRLLLPGLLLVACTQDPAKTDPDDTAVTDDVDSAHLDDTYGPDDTDTDPDDTGGPSDPNCEPMDVTVEVTDVTTVLRVRWSTFTPSSGHIEFGKAGALDHVSPSTPEGTNHEMLVLGMTADTDVSFRVVSSNASCDAATEVQTTRTGSLPSGLYPTRATGTATWTGYQVLPLQGSGYAVVIVDNEGHYVWYHQLSPYGNLMRAFLSADGQHVLLCHAGSQESLENGKIVKIKLDGSEVTEVDFPYIDHDMVELPDGTLAAIVVQNQDGRSADKIMELAPDGTVTEIFNAWDAFDPDALGIPEHENNWTHGNALDYDPVEDVYYLSMKSMGSLAKISRATGEVLWTMNGYANQFGGATVQMHHQFDVRGDTILFFENGPADRGYSRAVEVRFDEEALTSEEIWEYISDPPLYVFAKGDVHRLDDGLTQVVWSSAGQIQNVTAEGEVAWQMDLDLGQAITFVDYAPSMYASQW